MKFYQRINLIRNVKLIIFYSVAGFSGPLWIRTWIQNPEPQHSILPYNQWVEGHNKLEFKE